jgi:hypothetical protein
MEQLYRDRLSINVETGIVVGLAGMEAYSPARQLGARHTQAD